MQSTSSCSRLTADIPAPSIVCRRAALGGAAVLVTLLLVGLVVDVVVDGSWLGAWDLDVTRWIAERRTGPIDAVANVGSSLTDTFTVLGVLVGAVAALVAAGRARHGLVLVLSVATEFTCFLVTSYAIARDRPDVEPLGQVPSTHSFPSGHVAVAVALYGALALVAASLTAGRGVPGVGRVAAVVVAVVVVFVAGSRLYEGVHHPIDLAGGALLGVCALGSAAWAAGLLARPVSTGTSSRQRGDHHEWSDAAPPVGAARGDDR